MCKALTLSTFHTLSTLNLTAALSEDAHLEQRDEITSEVTTKNWWSQSSNSGQMILDQIKHSI